jgi:hypothetical protein
MEFGDGPFSNSNAGPGVNGFCLVTEKEGRATGQGAQLDAWKRKVWIRGKLLLSFHSWIGGIHERKEKTFTNASTACEKDIVALEEILKNGGLLLSEVRLSNILSSTLRDKRRIVRHVCLPMGTTHGSILC